MNTHKNILLEAHRGVSNAYPENTLAAFEAAARLGYDMIELDTKFTADDRCVLLHDRSVNRTARADGEKLTADAPIASLTLSEAKKLDFGVWRGEEFRGVSIPSLEETADLALKKGIPLKFDNVIQSHTPAQLEYMLKTLEEMGAMKLCGFTSNSLEFIAALADRVPAAAIHYDGEPSEEKLSALSKIVPRERLTVWLRYPNAHTAWAKTPPVTRELADTVHKYAAVGVWLLTERIELDAAAEIGADIAETDGSIRPDMV